MRRFFAFCFVLCLLRQTVFAAYDHAVSWSEMDTPNLDSVLRSRYASRGNLLEPVVSSFTTERALNDLDGRIDSAFRIPLELTP